MTSGVYGLLDMTTSYMRNQPDNSSFIPLLVGAIAGIAAISVPKLIQNKNIEVDYKEHNPKMEKVIFKFISDYRKSAHENKTPYNYQNLLNKLTNYAPKNILMDLIAKYEKQNNIKIPRIHSDENKKSNNLINRLLGR